MSIFASSLSALENLPCLLRRLSKINLEALVAFSVKKWLWPEKYPFRVPTETKFHIFPQTFATINFLMISTPRTSVVTTLVCFHRTTPFDCHFASNKQRYSLELFSTSKYGHKTFWRASTPIRIKIKCGELLPAEEEGGKNSSQYFIKYLSRLIMLKMYRKCTDAPFTPFLMIEMLKHCLA